MFNGLFVILFLMLLSRVGIVALQSRLEKLVQALKSDPALYKQAGSPTDDYFAWGLFLPRFFLFLLKNKTCPPPVLKLLSAEDYAHIRRIFIVFESLHYALAIIVIGIFIGMRIFR
jgi:hypothetical protein